MKVYVIRTQHEKKAYYWNGYPLASDFMKLGGCFVEFGAQMKLLGRQAQQRLDHLKEKFPKYDLHLDCLEGDVARDLMLVQLGYSKLGELFEI